MFFWMIAALAIFWTVVLGARLLSRLQPGTLQPRGPRERRIVIVCSTCNGTEEISQEKIDEDYGGPEWVEFKCSKCKGASDESVAGGEG